MSRETTCAGQGCGDCTVCRLRGELASYRADMNRERENYRREVATLTVQVAQMRALRQPGKSVMPEVLALRSRLSTVERERDEALEVMAKWEREAEDTLSRLTAAIAERDAIREKAQGDIAGLRGRLKSQARHLADRTRERDEGRGLLGMSRERFAAMAAVVTSSFDAERVRLLMLEGAGWCDAYLSRSPVEGGRET